VSGGDAALPKLLWNFLLIFQEKHVLNVVYISFAAFGTTVTARNITTNIVGRSLARSIDGYVQCRHERLVDRPFRYNCLSAERHIDDNVTLTLQQQQQREASQ